MPKGILEPPVTRTEEGFNDLCRRESIPVRADFDNEREYRAARKRYTSRERKEKPCTTFIP